MPVALVTGGSVGIGRACALGLAADGFDIALTYRSHEREAQDVAGAIASFGRRVEMAKLDFADDVAVTMTRIASLASQFDSLDVLVNNAGISPRKSILGESSAELTQTMQVNFLVPAAIAREAAARMIDQGGGRIINITSVLASLPLDQCASYCASKAALEMFTRVAALELAPQGILVNAVAPGHTATPMNYGSDEGAADALAKEWTSIPMRRPADPLEIAHVVRFLASSRASYVTGATLCVDGGLSLPNGSVQLQAEMGLPPKPQGSG